MGETDQKTAVTLSFDDGHPHDFRALDLLLSRGLKATFYIAFNHPKEPEITPAQMRALSDAGMEIGSHTLSHRMLVLLSPAEVRRELSESKARLEDITGKPVTALSYPLGYINADILKAMGETGYRVGRTQMLFRTDRPADPLRIPMTLDATPQPRIALLKHMVRDWNLGGLFAWGGQGLANDPDRLFAPLLAAARAKGGVFHLYARSWELSRANRWEGFTAMLDALTGLPGCRYVTNSESAAA